MTANESYALTPEDIRLLDTGRVAEYLTSRGWVVSTPPAARGLFTVFGRPEPRHSLFQLRIPESKDLADYDDVMWRSLEALSKFEKVNLQTVLGNLLYFADDLILVREDTPDTKSGSVALDRAASLLSGIKKSLLSAAHLEIEPQLYYARLDRADAELFLSHCRFGQTRRSSYAMTVACPLNAVPDATNPQQEPLFGSPFARRVTTRLMSSVHAVVGAARHEDPRPLVQNDDRSLMVNANLCDALAELAPTDPSGKLELSCSWAKKRPLDDETESPSVVTLRSEMTPFIESLGQTLRAMQHPNTKQDFVGRIDTLNGRPDEKGGVSGPVYGRVTDTNNDTIRVRIDLNTEQYKVALEAHGANKLVMVTGILRRVSTGGMRIENHSGLKIISSSK